MQKVDFYLLGGQSADGKLKFACRLCNKLSRMGKRVFVYTGDAQLAGRLDQLMWTFSDTAFVPHYNEAGARTLTGNGEDDLTRVVIGHQAPRLGDLEVLVSLADEVPEFCGDFERIAEVVDGDPQDKAGARLRYKAYQDLGYELTTHEVAS